MSRGKNPLRTFAERVTRGGKWIEPDGITKRRKTKARKEIHMEDFHQGLGGFMAPTPISAAPADDHAEAHLADDGGAHLEPQAENHSDH